MSIIDEIKNDAKNIVAKFEAVDTAALAKMEQLQANPGAVQLVDTALSYLHLPPAAFNTAITVLGEVGKLYEPQQTSQQPEPTFTAAGPQVGGQAH